MALQNQPTAMPTRKIAAVIIAGMLVGGVQSALTIFWPDHPFAPIMSDLDVWIQYGVMALAGYMTKESA